MSFIPFTGEPNTSNVFTVEDLQQKGPRLFRKCCLIYQAEFTSELVDDVVRAVMILGSSWLVEERFSLYFWDTDPLRTMVCNGDTVLSQSRLLSFKAQSPLCVVGQNPDGSATVSWDKVSCCMTTSCEPFWLLFYVVCVSVHTCNSSNLIWSSVPLYKVVKTLPLVSSPATKFTNGRSWYLDINWKGKFIKLVAVH